MAIVQASLIFYACSRGFGTSIIFLDDTRLNQIQAVSGKSSGGLAETKQLVNCNKRHFRPGHYLPLKMLRRRYLSPPYASKTT